jgi:Peptidase family S41
MVVSPLAALVCVIAALGAQAAPAAKPEAPDRGDLLLGLARAWAEAKFFHPAMFQRAIDWDGALVRAIPEVEAASDAKTYRAAIERLLAAMGDPETKVLEARGDGAPPSPWKEWATQDVLVLHARPPSEHYDSVKAERLVADVRADLEHAKLLVADLRGAYAVDGRMLTALLDQLPQFRTPIATGRHHGNDTTTRWMQQLPSTAKPLYRGKVVVLIDDRAVSAAEHTCLVLEAAAGATFVGTPTDGTDGEETYERLPGGVEMRFTGQEVLHVDGRQLQQIGIQPNIRVSPTLRGLRTGKDEVLDRALRYLQTGK